LFTYLLDTTPYYYRTNLDSVRDIKIASFGFTFGLPPPLPQIPVVLVSEQVSPPKSTKKIPAKRKYVRKAGTVAKNKKSVVDVSAAVPKRRGRSARKVETEEVKSITDDQEKKHETEIAQDADIVPEDARGGPESLRKTHVTKSGKRKGGKSQKKGSEEQSAVLADIKEVPEDIHEELKQVLSKPVKASGPRKRKAATRPEPEADHAEEVDEDNLDDYKPKSRGKRTKRTNCNVPKAEGAPRKTRNRIVVKVLHDFSTLKPPLRDEEAIEMNTGYAIKSAVPLVAKPRRRGRQVKVMVPVEEPQPETLAPPYDSATSTIPGETATTKPQSDECSPNGTTEGKTAIHSLDVPTDIPAQPPSHPEDSSNMHSRNLPTKPPAARKQSSRIHLDPISITETTTIRTISVTGRVTRRAAEASRLCLQDIARSEAEDIAKENEEARARSKQKSKGGKEADGIRRRGRVPLGERVVNIQLAVGVGGEDTEGSEK